MTFVLFTEDVYFIYASLCINCIIKTINNALYLSDAGDGDTQTMCKLCIVDQIIATILTTIANIS